MVYSRTFMLFGATHPNALRQSHTPESAHLQSLSLRVTWLLVDNRINLSLAQFARMSDGFGGTHRSPPLNP